MSGLLDRPGDKPAPAEEAAVARVEKMTGKIKREWNDTIRALQNSRTRYLAYEAKYELPDCRMERNVQDRLLGRLVALKPSLKHQHTPECLCG